MALKPRDILICEAIQKHGPLPSHYLYEFTKHAAHDRDGFTKRLLKLTRDGLLDRPIEFNNPHIKDDFKVYTLTNKGCALLGEVGKLHKHATPVSGHADHQLMTACVTANIELEAIKAGVRYISQEEMLAGPRCPQSTKGEKYPTSLPVSITYSFPKKNGTWTDTWKGPTIPDQVFGLAYGNTGVRFFALEADRGTEPITRQNLQDNSILRKILSYKDIMIRGEYKIRYGVPNLFPLFVTTAEDRVENMLAQARTLYTNGSNFILFKAASGFLRFERTPPLHPQLFGIYRRTGEDFDISKV